jgi:hypothetical protein
VLMLLVVAFFVFFVVFSLLVQVSGVAATRIWSNPMCCSLRV